MSTGGWCAVFRRYGTTSGAAITRGAARGGYFDDHEVGTSDRKQLNTFICVRDVADDCAGRSLISAISVAGSPKNHTIRLSSLAWGLYMLRPPRTAHHTTGDRRMRSRDTPATARRKEGGDEHVFPENRHFNIYAHPASDRLDDFVRSISGILIRRR